jgi:hypothetical protein
MPRPWHVQKQADDGLFHTVENGTHASFHAAYWHYAEVAEEGVALLLRGDHILLRSDELVDQPADSLF